MRFLSFICFNMFKNRLYEKKNVRKGKSSLDQRPESGTRFYWRKMVFIMKIAMKKEFLLLSSAEMFYKPLKQTNKQTWSTLFASILVLSSR